MTTTARGVDSGLHDRTKILTPFVLSIFSSCAFARIAMSDLLALRPCRASIIRPACDGPHRSARDARALRPSSGPAQPWKPGDVFDRHVRIDATLIDETLLDPSRGGGP